MNLTLDKTNCTQSNVTGEQSYVPPVTNIREHKDGYLLEAELPGVSKDGLELTVTNDELILTGRRNPAPSTGRPVYRESRSLDYRRAFELDASIDVTKITAKFDQGVLTLQLPKAEAVKPRKITVTD